MVYVKPTGRDTYAGSSWAYARKTVQSGINAASSGSEVWVAQGSYMQAITLKSGVSLYGGFAGTEALRSQRKPATYATYLDGGSANTVVTAPPDATAATVIDGFTIRNGRGASGGGIYAANASITISNNAICDNSAAYYGGGIYGESSMLTIINNAVTRNKAPFGAGIACYDSASPTITGNRIYSNTADYDGSGIYCYSNSTPVIAGNLIYSNTALSEGAGIYCDDASPTIVNNTISDNTASTHGGGLACLDSSPIIANNIITFSSSGIRSAGTGAPTVRGNVVAGNAAYGYSGVTAGADDVATDPLFVNKAGQNYHLQATSAAVNAGWNEAPGIGSLDIDGEARIAGGAIDIGADEVASVPAALTSLPSAKSGLDKAWVKLPGTTVSAAFPGYFYIESDNRTLGIRVEKAGHTISQGQRAVIEGVVKVNDQGERYLSALSAVPGGNGEASPLYMVNRAIGGSDWQYDPLTGKGQRGVSSFGLNNIGLLVKTSGAFHWDASDTFTIDDGSGVHVKCVTGEGVTIQQSWTFATITGVSSCEKVGDELRRLIRIRTQSDIQAF